jgi:toluene monooxygenase system ferredoxin subunit
MAFTKVAAIDDLWSGEMTTVAVEGRQILLVNIEGEVRAYLDACPHKRTPLSLGTLRGLTLACATHQWEFDLRTGKGINPADACLESLEVRLENGDILLEVQHA